MKRSSFFLLSLLILVIPLAAQEISRQEGDSMINLLNKIKPAVDRLELLLNLAQFHIFKPGENKIDLDSAVTYINEAKVLNRKINSPNTNGYLLLTESYLVKERGPKVAIPPYFTSEESKKMVENAIKVLASGTNKEYLGRAYYELSGYFDYDDSLQALRKIELVKQSVEAFQQAGNLKGKGRSLEMLGDLYFIWDQNDKSNQSLREALAAYTAINYPKLQGVYVLLGRLYFFKHEQAPALFNLLKALKAAHATKDSSMQLCQINNYLGMVYNDIDRMDMAVKYLNDALQIAQKFNDEEGIYTEATSLSNAYNNLRQPEQSLKVLGYIPKTYLLSEDPLRKATINTVYLRTYLALKQLAYARPRCEIIIRMADRHLGHASYDRKAKIYMYAADFYFLSNEYTKARYYLAKSNTIAKQTNNDYVQVHNLELSYKMDSIQRNFKLAFNHLIQYKEKTDFVFGERKARQFQVMNVEYEVAIKEDSIKAKDKDISQLVQRNNLQQANLKQASLIKNITGGGIILALIIIVLLYRQYSRKQKNNQVITQKNEQLQHLNEQQTKLLTEKDWLVKEIHHRVKNNLQMVVSLLNTQTEFLTHPSAIDAIKESRERMQAIAIIHQKLYQLDNSTQINMRSYINELINNIQHSFADSEKINFIVDVADVSLDISQSVPLGLILNEAITNAIKYAYPKNEKGMIQISLKHSSIDKLQLKIADNGKGLPANVDIEHSNTLGIQLIRLFSEQLEGDLYFINNNGLGITLNFKFEDKYFESHKVSS